MKEELKNQLVLQILDYPGLSRLSATEVLAMISFINAGLKGLVQKP